MVPEQIDLQKVNVAATSGSGSGSSGGGSQNPLEAGEEPLDNDDYVSAKDYVIATGKASSSALQTAFGWGFPKSNKIVFLLERHGVVGPANGAKPREVLIGRPSNNDAEE
jgi:S-DNA-T family DNA segregation ATPase FtsK/SpoIIIE